MRSDAERRGAGPVRAEVAPPQLGAVLGDLVAFRILAGRVRAPWLVGLHGLGSSGADLVEAAHCSGLPAVLVDLPGFGDSGRPERAYPVRRAAEVVLALLERLAVGRAVWLGCSYGAHVALRAALDQPAAVAALVLAGAGGLAHAVDPAILRAFDERVLRARSAEAVRAATAALAARRTAWVERFIARRVAEHERGADAASYSAIARSAAGALADDVPSRLEDVAVPVAIVHGALDRLVPLAVAEQAASRFPRASVRVLEGTGHLPWLEDPQALGESIRAAAGALGPACAAGAAGAPGVTGAASDRGPTDEEVSA